MNKSLLRYVAGAAVAAAAIGIAPGASALDLSKAPAFRHPEPLAFARKAQPKGTMSAKAEMNLETLRKKAVQASPSKELDASNELGYLYGPNNELWYYVAQYDVERIQHEYFVEQEIKGFTYTVYDSKLNEVGTVSDVVRLHGNENSVRALSLDPQITKRFFNSDDKYEIVVGMAASTPEYKVNTYSMAYSLNGAKDAEGHTQKAGEFEGYIVDAVDLATDRWSERYYISFLTEEDGNPDDYETWLEYLATYKGVITTYKYAGYGTPPESIATFKVPMMNMPGDSMSAPFFLSKKNGKTYDFYVVQYEKSFFVDPTGMGGNEDITPDNSLIIDSYTIPESGASTVEHKHHVSIKCDPDPNYLCSYYSVGTMLGDDDVDYTMHGTPENPAFFVAVQNYSTLADERYTTMYYLYDTNGNRKATVAEYVDGLRYMSDIPGKSPQVMFVTPDIEGYFFKFVDLATVSEVLSIKNTHEGHSLTASLDRHPVGSSYQYVCELLNGYSNDNDEWFVRMANINPDGTIERIDDYNMGKNVAYAQFYVSGEAMSPYIFNTDENNEMMALVKRYIDPELYGSQTREELLIVGAGLNEPLLAIGPDANKGVLTSISLMASGAQKQLLVAFEDDDHNYYQEIYELPLTKFVGGDGSAESPYRIATVGDLQAIRHDTSAHYAIVNDFDAANYEFLPIPEFTGELDGNLHTISNLSLEAALSSVGIFTSTRGANIHDITFVNPTITLKAANTYTGLITGTMSGTYDSGVPGGSFLDNIHVYGLKVTGNDYDDEFGSLIGRATLGNKVTRCFVKDADINLPSSSVGGIVGSLMTSSGVEVSAFSGKIVGGAYVGGIAGSADSASPVKNNHVTAEITANNTLGGIIGSAARAKVFNNYFHGSLKALNPNRWNGSYGMGGIIGALDGPTADSTTPDEIVISNNIADITSHNYTGVDKPEEWDGQNSTVHRIIGWSRTNARYYPAEGEKQHDPDPGLANNYALSETAVVDAAVGAGHNTTEGESLDRNDLHEVFLKGLGYAHGTTTDAPWNTMSVWPSLHFENVIVIPVNEVRAELDKPFNVPVTVTSRVPMSADELMSSIVITNDESHIKKTGNYTYDGKTLNIEFSPLCEAYSKLVLTCKGSVAMTHILTGQAGVTDITVDGAEDADAPVEYYDLRGIRIDRPVPGSVIIRRQGTNVTKVIVD